MRTIELFSARFIACVLIAGGACKQSPPAPAGSATGSGSSSTASALPSAPLDAATPLPDAPLKMQVLFAREGSVGDDETSLSSPDVDKIVRGKLFALMADCYTTFFAAMPPSRDEPPYSAEVTLNLIVDDKGKASLLEDRDYSFDGRTQLGAAYEIDKQLDACVRAAVKTLAFPVPIREKLSPDGHGGEIGEPARAYFTVPVRVTEL